MVVVSPPMQTGRRPKDCANIAGVHCQMEPGGTIDCAYCGRAREPLLNDGEQHSLRREFVAFLTSKGFPCTSTIEQGQPLTLEIWRALLAYLQDIDCNLPSILKEGVPTGIVSDIQASGVWIPRDTPERVNGVGASRHFSWVCRVAAWRCGRSQAALRQPLRGRPSWFKGPPGWRQLYFPCQSHVSHSRTN